MCNEILASQRVINENFLIKCSCVIMAVNAWCCGLLEGGNYSRAPPTSELRISVRVISPLASGIIPFLEVQEGLYRSQIGSIVGVFSRSISINGYAVSQRGFDNGISLSIHKTVELFNQ